MNRLSNTTILINFVHISPTDLIFPRSGLCDIDKQIVDVLVRDSLAGDSKAKLALYTLSQVSKCASRCLDNSFFFKELFSLQHPSIANKFKFSLLLSCYPNVWCKVLCDVLPTMRIEQFLPRNLSGNDEDEFSEGEAVYCTRRLSQPQSSYKFRHSFLNEGMIPWQNILKAEKLELEKEYNDLCSLPDPYLDGVAPLSGEVTPEDNSETEEASVDTEKESSFSLAAQIERDTYYKKNKCCLRIKKLKEGLLGSVNYEGYNLLLFSELGRAKLHEELLLSLPFMEKCFQLVTAILAGRGITVEQKNQIVDLVRSCHWAVKNKLADQLDLDFDDGVDVDVIFEAAFTDTWPKLQKGNPFFLTRLQGGASGIIHQIKNAEEMKDSEGSFFDDLSPPIVSFDANSSSRVKDDKQNIP
jgi:hypothetical protein